MTISVGSNAASYLSYAGNAYGAGNTASKASPASTDTTDTSAPSSSTSVTLSDEAKAYLARTAAESEQPSIATLTTRARAWFDQQYVALGTSSAMLDGQVAVDFSGQTRATLSVIADNANGQFSTDEVTAATRTLQARFNDAVSPHVVIARHTGDYASLYAAASDYLDQAGSDEKATAAWKDQKQAVLEGLAAARASFGKAPVTGNDADPVRALLDKARTQTSSNTDSSPDALVTNARAMLDAQAGNARDNGKDLVFTGGRQAGQQVDFTDFDNRTLAIMALNADASFSAQEASAAKAELNQRTRSSLVNAFGGDGIRANSLSLLQQYSNMSSEERSVLGFTEDYANRIVANYRTAASIQNNLGSGAGLAAYF
ncbi:hypothetical protein CQ12_30135 [Bradyrhizobium jicamae]|uniref:Uncharacterized protein n=1 Tax=Bradyrhizobium jicamae TaxID=280332 RepID=A0A0R3KPH4_9BRAD|nr:hypothetical protein [Bradyrhizobium jicamae]KRQ95204.1 hypothetical protein CQ12_30135 [Bradyrhizobium jicamae]